MPTLQRERAQEAQEAAMKLSALARKEASIRTAWGFQKFLDGFMGKNWIFSYFIVFLSGGVLSSSLGWFQKVGYA